MGRTSLKIQINDPKEGKKNKVDEEPNCCERMFSCLYDDSKKNSASNKTNQAI